MTSIVTLESLHQALLLDTHFLYCVSGYNFENIPTRSMKPRKLGYLFKYIPLTTKNQYLKNMTDKVENFVKGL